MIQNKKTTIILSLSLSCLMLMSTFMIVSNPNSKYPNSSAVVSNPTEIYGIQVGVGDYPGSSLDLNGPFWDVWNMYWLIKWTFWADWVYGDMEGEKVACFNDNEATKENIEQAFERISDSVDPNDLFVFQYSGHGAEAAFGAPAWMCFYDIFNVTSPNYNSNYSTPLWLNSMLGKIKCNILVIIDACHSGEFIPTIKGRNRCVMAASQADEVSWEIGAGSLARGLFTVAFETAYTEKYDPNRDSITTLKEAIDNATAVTIDYSTNSIGTPQNPVADNQLGDKFSLENFQDSDGDGVSDNLEVIDGTNRFDSTDNRNAINLAITGTVFSWLFFIFLILAIVLMIYFHNNGRQIPAAMEAFPQLEDKIPAAFKKENVTPFNALSIATIEPRTGNLRNSLALFLNRGKSILFTNPTEIRLPKKCVITGEDLSDSSILDFQIQGCVYKYPSNCDIPEKDRKQYALKVPVSMIALERIKKADEKNQKTLKLFSILFLANFILYCIMMLFVSQDFAGPLFWILMLGICIVVIYQFDKIISVDNYFMATRIDANRIEIKIHNSDYEQTVKQLNGLV